MTKPRFHEPGHHTAYGGVLDYRLRKLEQHGVIRGDWLDLGCADGYYAVGLAERGASSVVGLEVDAGLVERASALPHPDTVSFVHGEGERLPFEDNSFDGVLLNEVLEHVHDDAATVREAARVLRPGGVVAIFSPNRWFPFEGHGARWSDDRVLFGYPVPLMPWLPTRLTNRVATARNYWPQQLAQLARDADVEILSQGWALAMFEQYPWIPARAAEWYRANLLRVERSPVARLFAVSTFILAGASSVQAPGLRAAT
jgi:SAM-dependent methyltransferase